MSATTMPMSAETNQTMSRSRNLTTVRNLAVTDRRGQQPAPIRVERASPEPV
jgi:hypothetical protein